MKRLREETATMPSGTMQITPEQGQFFAMLVELLNAKKALEIGVFTGYSAISVARALPPDGKLIACDVSEDFTRVARRYWKEMGLDHKIDLRLAPATDTLDGLIAEGAGGSFDFAFIDADKENYDNYYERVLSLLRRGGVVAIDNVLWHGRVVDPHSTDAETESIRRLNRKIHTDERVFASMLPLGDGVTLAIKRRD
jgi:caffeoyl-CoA O-methyltransferase